MRIMPSLPRLHKAIPYDTRVARDPEKDDDCGGLYARDDDNCVSDMTGYPFAL
jgi:hypothetical protein